MAYLFSIKATIFNAHVMWDMTCERFLFKVFIQEFIIQSFYLVSAVVLTLMKFAPG